MHVIHHHAYAAGVFFHTLAISRRALYTPFSQWLLRRPPARTSACQGYTPHFLEIIAAAYADYMRIIPAHITIRIARAAMTFLSSLVLLLCIGRCSYSVFCSCVLFSLSLVHHLAMVRDFSILIGYTREKLRAHMFVTWEPWLFAQLRKFNATGG